jgi:hypothetical protein
MRKLMFFMVIAGSGFWYLKSNGNILSDDHTQAAGFALPTLGVGTASGVMSTVTAWLQGAAVPTSAAKQPVMPAAPVASANPGNISPDLLKYLNPSLLTTSPAGAQTLTPAGQQVLQQIIAQARANPAAFKDQAAKTVQSAR